MTKTALEIIGFQALAFDLSQRALRTQSFDLDC